MNNINSKAIKDFLFKSIFFTFKQYTFMRKQVLILLGVVAAIATSCDNQADLLGNDLNLARSVSGVYDGTLTNSVTGQSRDATLTVTYENDSLVSLNCVADGFDTTMTMRLYQNYDSIMLCSTGDDFYEMYGHQYRGDVDFSHSMDKNSMNHNMNCNCWAGDDQWNAWTNHMNTQHDADDRHYGGFDTKSHTSNFDFQMNDGQNMWFESFRGVKKSS